MDAWTAIFAALAAIANVVTAIIAWFALQSWRAEFRGRTDEDIARRLLIACTHLREGFRSARQELVWTGELRESLRLQGVPETELDVTIANGGEQLLRAEWDLRMKRLTGPWSDLRAAVLEAESLWGAPIRTALDRIQAGPLAEFRTAARQNARSLSGAVRKPLSPAQEARIEEVLYEDDEGGFGFEIDAAISEVEQLAKKRLPYRSR